MNVSIRPAQKHDIEALVSLLHQLFEIEEDFSFDENKQRKGLELMLESNSNKIIVAEYQSEIIGLCTMQMLISTAEGGHVGLVEDMVVSNRYIGQGIGRKLISEIEDWAKSKGFTRLQLLADHENRSALDFYAKMGWSKTNLIGLRKVI